MITSLPERRSLKNRSAGFTLTEVLMAASLSAMILAGVLSTSVLIIRSSVRASNYSIMEAETRRAFEQMGIDARMASDFSCVFTNGSITSFTLTIPNEDLSQIYYVTYGYDTSNSANQVIFIVPGNNPAATVGRRVLVNQVNAMTFLRYDATSILIPAATISNAGIKHIQMSVSVLRTGVGIVNTTQVIRSSAFTLRNISI